MISIKPKLWFVALLGLACGVPAASDWAILSPEQAPLAIGQCSRDAPGNGAPYWQRMAPGNGAPFWKPTVGQVRQLEEKLPSFLEAKGHRDHATRLRTYRRQYVGFTRAGREVIYLNAFPASFINRVVQSCQDDHDLFGVTREPCKHPDFWRRAPVMVCDGGDGFWGVEYDPEAKQFSNLHFNGDA